MNALSKRLIFANSFGTLGYISTVFQWLWSFLVLSYPLLSAKPDFLFLPPAQSPPPETVGIEASPFMIVIAVAATIVILAITVVVILHLPKTIGKKSATFTHTTAKTILPVITHHKKVTKKKRIELSYRIIIGIKLFLITLPLLALPFAQHISTISTDVIWAVAVFCASCSIVYFAVQQLVAHVTRLDKEKIW